MPKYTSPAKAGFTRLRGRPKQPKLHDEGTDELQQKRRRVRDIVAKDAKIVTFSWLHIAHHDETISQDLFDLGMQYLRLRFRVLRSMQPPSFRLGCHALTRDLGRMPSLNMEKRDKQAEECWNKLASVTPAKVIHTLDELLLGNVAYEILPERIRYNKKRLKDALVLLNRFKDYL